MSNLPTSLSAVPMIVATVGLLPVARVRTASFPELPVALYGFDGGSNAPDTMALTVPGNNESAIVSTIQTVTVDTHTFYLTRIPFKTLQVTGSPDLSATPGTECHDLHFVRNAQRSRRGRYDGLPTLTYGAVAKGYPRVDLTLSGETYAPWVQRVFGSLVSQTAEADVDGQSNYDETLDGTDPKHPASQLRGVRAVTQWFNAAWDTVAGKTYLIERSRPSPDLWPTLQSGVQRG